MAIKRYADWGITMVSSVAPRGAWTEDVAKEDTVETPVGPAEAMKEKKTRAANPWLIHVAAFKKAHPEMKYKDVLVQAKETYVKITRAVAS